jgi:hypothetical protein
MNGTRAITHRPLSGPLAATGTRGRCGQGYDTAGPKHRPVQTGPSEFASPKCQNPPTELAGSQDALTAAAAGFLLLTLFPGAL